MQPKQHAEELALFGGPPAFDQPFYVGRPNIGNRTRLKERLDQILDCRWLTNNGAMVQEFERRLRECLGVRHCIAVCNGTVALEIMFRALELRGEVILPSFTFIATAHALQWQEITPVFCDVDPRTHNLDPARVEECLTPHTTGIIGVHLWGRPCAIEELAAIADRRGLKLAFDASHAFGCSHRGTKIGGFGKAEVFSFHSTKFLNTFEGGAIATNDDELARKIRLMKNFGFAGFDNVIYVGTNGKMHEMSAAMGVTNLESLAEFIEHNRRNHAAYAQHLAGIPGLELLRFPVGESANYQYVVTQFAEDAPLPRDTVLQLLQAENVIARRYFYPGCHRMEPYRSLFPRAGTFLPVTERLAQSVMTLPTGTAVSPDDVAAICELLRFIMSRASEIKDRQGAQGS